MNIFHDITARKAAEEQLRASEERYRKLAEERQQLVRDLSAERAELERARNDLSRRVRELEEFEEVVVGRELKTMRLEKEVEKYRGHRTDLDGKKSNRGAP